MATYRQIHVKIWSSPDFLELSPEGRLVFIYLFSNSHRNEAALYRISLKTIAGETGLKIKDLNLAISELEKNLIKYDREKNIVWVINALKYQKLSPNEVKSIRKSLSNIDHEFVQEFLSYYNELLLYYEGTTKVLPSTSEVVHEYKGKGKGKGKGNDKNKKNKPPLPPKIKYAEFVSLTEAEYQRLVEEYGEPFVKRCIEVLDNYKGSKGVTYKDDNRAIRNWVVMRVREETERPKQRSPSLYPKEVL